MAKVKEIYYAVRRNIPHPEDSYQHIHLEVGETVTIEEGDVIKDQWSKLRSRMQKRLDYEIKRLENDWS